MSLNRLSIDTVCVVLHVPVSDWLSFCAAKNVRPSEWVYNLLKTLCPFSHQSRRDFAAEAATHAGYLCSRFSSGPRLPCPG